jgi:prepilin-type N-terminal cleavage/methylation domain-containing protein
MKNCKYVKIQNGYTLVELSVVLVILSIGIIGAVKGASIITAYRLQGVVTNFQQYKIAITEFRQKYNSLPGDTTDATAIWANSNDVVNGNGDGFISTTEQFQAWRHLYLADYIKFSASGLSGNYVFNGNVPAANFTNSAYRIYSDAATTGASSAFYNFIDLTYAVGTIGSGGILKPSDAEILDKKADDGFANSGIVRGQNGTDNTGAAIAAGTACIASNVYQVLENSTKSCISRFILSEL